MTKNQQDSLLFTKDGNHEKVVSRLIFMQIILKTLGQKNRLSSQPFTGYTSID